MNDPAIATSAAATRSSPDLPEPLELQRRVAMLEAELAEARSQAAQAARQLLDVEAKRAGDLARIAAVEAERVAWESRLEALEAELERARGWGAGLEQSVSWRITAPLRAVVRLLRRLTGRR